MINIIHVDIHCNDRRQISAIDVKLKSFKEETRNIVSGHSLVTTVSMAFYKTTLLTDSGKSLTTTLNPKRKDIVNLSVTLDKGNNLSFADVSNFLSALQEALDKTSAF